MAYLSPLTCNIFARNYTQYWSSSFQHYITEVDAGRHVCRRITSVFRRSVIYRVSQTTVMSLSSPFHGQRDQIRVVIAIIYRLLSPLTGTVVNVMSDRLKIISYVLIIIDTNPCKSHSMHRK